MTDRAVVVRFVGEDDVTPVAKSIQGSVNELGTTADKAGSKFDALGKIAEGAFMRLGNIITDVALAGVQKVGQFFSDSITEATEFQNVFAQTQAVIASTGAAAGKTAEEMAGLASDLSAASGMSLFSDDSILGAQNILATFTQIGGPTFDNATQAILDVSQAMGQDLKSSTIQIGKALNDPIAGIGALSRVGVQFTSDQKAMIESMVEGGNVAGAQAVILEELNKQFGGSAAAAVNTYAGQMTVLSEQFNDVKQGVGEALLPILQELGRFAVQYVVPAVQEMATAFTEWVNSVDWVGLMSLFDSLFTTLSDSITSVDWDGIFATISTAIDTVLTTFYTLRDVFYEVLGAITTQIDIFWGIVEPVWNQLVSVFEEAYKQLEPLGAVFNEAFGDVSKQSEAMAPIGEILGNIVTAILNVIGVIVKVLVPIIQVAFPIFINYIKDLVDTFMRLYNTINYVFSGKMQQDISKWWEDTVNGISTKISNVIASVKQVGTNIISGLIDGIESMRQKLYDSFSNLVTGAVAWLKKLLGIASPSKLMADAIGKPMAQGIAAGMLSSAGAVQTAAGLTVSGAGAATVNNYYQLTATYNTMQSESSILQDMRALQLASGNY
jgi:phage-related protein